MMELSFYNSKTLIETKLSIGRGTPRHGQAHLITITKLYYSDRGQVEHGQMLWTFLYKAGPYNRLSNKPKAFKGARPINETKPVDRYDYKAQEEVTIPSQEEAEGHIRKEPCCCCGVFTEPYIVENTKLGKSFVICEDPQCLAWATR